MELALSWWAVLQIYHAEHLILSGGRSRFALKAGEALLELAIDRSLSGCVCENTWEQYAASADGMNFAVDDSKDDSKACLGCMRYASHLLPCPFDVDALQVPGQ